MENNFEAVPDGEEYLSKDAPSTAENETPQKIPILKLCAQAFVSLLGFILSPLSCEAREQRKQARKKAKREKKDAHKGRFREDMFLLKDDPESWCKKHWLGLSMIPLFIVLVASYVLCRMIPWEPLPDLLAGLCALAAAVIGVWKHGSKDKDEARKYSKEKVEATIQYGLAMLTVILFIAQNNLPQA